MRSRLFFVFRSLFLIAACLFSTLSNSQNPLDIKSRLDQSEILNEVVTNSNNTPNSIQSDNPFDVKKEPNQQNSKISRPKEIKQNVNDQIDGLSKPIKIVILLGSIVFFVLVRNINLKGFNQIGQSFLSSVKMSEYKNAVNSLFNTQIGLFYIFFFINITYFIYLCIEKLNIQLPDLFAPPFLLILLLIMSIYLVKYFVLFLIEFALSIRRAVGSHLFSISIHNILLGFALFFINMFFAFTSGGIATLFMYLGIGLIVIFYLIRQVKGLQYLSEMRHFSFFHFFIYLCSCEISPLLVGVKMITG